MSGKRRQFGFKVATNAGQSEIKAAGVELMMRNTEWCSFNAKEYTADVCGSVRVHRQKWIQHRRCWWRRLFIQSFNLLMMDSALPAQNRKPPALKVAVENFEPLLCFKIERKESFEKRAPRQFRRKRGEFHSFLNNPYFTQKVQTSLCRICSSRLSGSWISTFNLWIGFKLGFLFITVCRFRGLLLMYVFYVMD